MRRAALRARARRTAARVIVRRPVYPVAARLTRTALLAARAAFRTGRDAQLEATLDRLARRDPGAAAVQVLRADLRTFQGRYEQAWRTAADAAERHPASAAATARAVRLGYRVRPRAEADRAAAAAAHRFPLAPDVMWAVAMACATPEQYARVAEAWQDSATGPADPLRVLRQLAVAAARAGRLDAAVSWYRRGIGLLLDLPGPPPRTSTVTRLAGLGARSAIANLDQALDRAGVPFFFAAGTALGLVREGRPLGSDSDLDVGVFDRDWDRDTLIEVFTRDPRFDLDLHPQSPKVGLRHRGGSPVDIFRFYEDGGKVWHDGVFVRWHNSPFRVARRRIGRRSVPLPEDPQRYLAECYGDWRIPWPGFDAFTDDAPNVEVTWPAYQRVHLARRAYDRLAAGDRAAASRELERAGDRELAGRVGDRLR